MAYPDALIYEFSQDGIRQILDQETEHYRLTRNFLANPQRTLDMPLEES
jgi:predicted ATPase